MTVTWQQIGLGMFVTTTLIMLLTLLYDLHLYLTGQTMITTYCRQNPWAAFILLWLIEAGILGLAVHFMRPIKIDKDSTSKAAMVIQNQDINNM